MNKIYDVETIDNAFIENNNRIKNKIGEFTIENVPMDWVNGKKSTDRSYTIGDKTYYCWSSARLFQIQVPITFQLSKSSSEDIKVFLIKFNRYNTEDNLLNNVRGYDSYIEYKQDNTTNPLTKIDDNTYQFTVEPDFYMSSSANKNTRKWFAISIFYDNSADTRNIKLKELPFQDTLKLYIDKFK